MVDKLEEIVRLQIEFMDKINVDRLGKDEVFDNSAHALQIQQSIPHFMFALISELGEIGDELNWKSWKKTRKPVNMTNLKMEFVDAFHFLIEMMISCGMNAESIYYEYCLKMKENLARQERGY